MIALLRRVQEHLDAGNSVRTMALNAEEQTLLRELWLLTGKPLMVIVNVDESPRGSPVPQDIVERASVAGGEAIAVSARIENDIAELDPADRAAFLHDLGLEEPGLHRVARQRISPAAADHLLHRRRHRGARVESSRGRDRA